MCRGEMRNADSKLLHLLCVIKHLSFSQLFLKEAPTLLWSDRKLGRRKVCPDNCSTNPCGKNPGIEKCWVENSKDFPVQGEASPER